MAINPTYLYTKEKVYVLHTIGKEKVRDVNERENSDPLFRNWMANINLILRHLIMKLQLILLHTQPEKRNKLLYYID